MLAGEREGTRFAAREARYSSFKLWLKYAKPSRGTLVIDAGAVRAVREGSASLLPVGVVDVLGEFDAGDAVDIAAGERAGDGAHGRTLAKGICNYSAAELRRVLGLKSDAVREILPRASDEAVHRDYLVSTDHSGFVVPFRAMATVISSVADICRTAKRARASSRDRHRRQGRGARGDRAALRARMEEILEANERDMQLGARSRHRRGAARPPAPRRGARRVRSRGAVRQIVALADPVGEVIDGQRLPNGLDVRKVRVPLGVVAVVYEARPNVTIDAAALCLKSGNAIVLRGSSSAAHSNAALAQIAAEAAVAAGLPDGCVSLVAGGGREELAELATQSDTVDLIIPRGGEGLKAGACRRWPPCP